MAGVFPMFGWLQMFALFSGTVSLLAPFAQVSKEWILTHGIANLQVPFDMGSFRTLPLVIGGGSPWCFSFVQHVLKGCYWRSTLMKPRPWLFGLDFGWAEELIDTDCGYWAWELWYDYDMMMNDDTIIGIFRFSQLLLLLRPVSTWKWPSPFSCWSYHLMHLPENWVPHFQWRIIIFPIDTLSIPMESRWQSCPR